MFCSNCGTSAESQQAFCVSCGHRLNLQSQPASTLTNPSPQSRVDLDAVNAPKSMSFIETIKFSYKNYAQFSGRASRSEYWYWVLFFWLGFIVLAISMERSSFFVLLYFTFIFSAIIPGIARAVRRLHDINKSGAFLFMGFIPLIGPVLLLVWFCTKSYSAPNKYGPALSEGFTSEKFRAFEAEAPASQNFPKEHASTGVKAKDLLVKYKLIVITATLAVIFVGVLQAHAQYGRLIGSIEVSEVQMVEFQREKDQIYDENVSGSPARFNSLESQKILESGIKDSSKLYGPRIFNAGESVRDISLLPWNHEHRTVKTNYLAHNFAWQKRLASLSADPYSELYIPNIDSTWKEFCQDLKAGIPWYAFGRFDSRIATICISDSDPS
jgi:uncharacterized membrane protein YhaH (DUF805 family)